MLGRSSKKRIILPIGAALLAFSFALPVAAADYAEEYRQYNEALAAGDQDAAIVHALAAWKGAEAVLGDHRTTAILAYNYGQQVLFEAPSEALPALKRAKELLDSGVAVLPVEDLDVYLAYAVMVTGGGRKSDAEALRAALAARESAGIPPIYEIALIWLELSLNDVGRNKFPEAIGDAARAERMFAETAPQAYRQRGLAIMVQGMSKLIPAPRSTMTVYAAHADFLRAWRLFPTQKDIETFDSVFAKIIAWDYAAHVAYVNVGDDDSTKPSDVLPHTLSNLPPILENVTWRKQCAHEWEERKPPKYPREALRRGFLGSVFIGFHLTEDGRVRDARILGEIPSETFGEAVLKAMQEWKHVLPMDTRPECMLNQTTQATFEVRY